MMVFVNHANIKARWHWDYCASGRCHLGGKTANLPRLALNRAGRGGPSWKGGWECQSALLSGGLAVNSGLGRSTRPKNKKDIKQSIFFKI